MAIVITWILFSLSIITIIVSFIMAPGSNSFSGALVGSADLELFKESKERGAKKWLKRIMFILGISLLVVALIIRGVM